MEKRQYKKNGLMWENGIPYPDSTELRNIFAASCVESAAIAENTTAVEMYRRMRAVNLFADFIYPCYETLHTQSRTIVTEDVLEALHNREKKDTLMRVYHGGTSIIDCPDVSKGRAGLDFGQGFYVTDLKQQADDWADRMARIRMAQGVVSVYDFDFESAKGDCRYKCFENYDIEWLDFFVRNRRGEHDTTKYDVVEGGVANDRVIDTVEAYMSNLMPLETALQNLAQHRPNNQICIRSQNVADKYLHFVESYNI